MGRDGELRSHKLLQLHHIQLRIGASLRSSVLVLLLISTGSDLLFLYSIYWMQLFRLPQITAVKSAGKLFPPERPI
jgi:hypothetical protein